MPEPPVKGVVEARGWASTSHHLSVGSASVIDIEDVHHDRVGRDFVEKPVIPDPIPVKSEYSPLNRLIFGPKNGFLLRIGYT